MQTSRIGRKTNKGEVSLLRFVCIAPSPFVGFSRILLKFTQQWPLANTVILYKSSTTTRVFLNPAGPQVSNKMFSSNRTICTLSFFNHAPSAEAQQFSWRPPPSPRISLGNFPSCYTPVQGLLNGRNVFATNPMQHAETPVACCQNWCSTRLHWLAGWAPSPLACLRGQPPTTSLPRAERRR